jgi:hypothetical protein
MRMTVTVAVRANDRATLERRTKRLRQRVKDLSAELRLLRWEQRAGWLAIAPLRHLPLSRRGLPVETGTVARTYPFSAGSLAIEGGVPFGVAAAAPVTFTPAAPRNKNRPLLLVCNERRRQGLLAASAAVARAVRQRAAGVGRQNLTRAQIRDADGVLELLWLLFTTVEAAAHSHQDLVLENLLLRHQLVVLTRPTRRRHRPHARLRLWDKLLWILARRCCAGWREHLSFVTPETVVGWHRQGWRLFWRWKSRSCGGRPHLSPEVRDLIASMSRDNRLWVLNGSEVSC